MDFYNQLLAQKLSGGGGGGDSNAAFKARIDGSMTDVTADMLDGLTTIGRYAFYDLRNLINVEIPSSITSIGESAFAGCTSLTTLTVPDSITSIGMNAFQNYANTWESLTFLSVVPPNCNQYFINGPVSNLTIYVPAESIDAYKSATGFSFYANQIQAIPSD